MIRIKHTYLAVLVVAICCALSLAFRQANNSLVNPSAAVLKERFNVPANYQRVTSVTGSFADYLQHLQLKPNGTLVQYYNGQEKPNKVAAAVLDIDVGNKDLQQCADAVMRLRAEFLYKTKQYDALHFNFTNGFKADYTKWRNGFRVAVNSNKVNWVKTTKESISYNSFREYLDKVFTYAGTASLAKELKLIALKDMQVGDVFIKGGSPGHAVIVVDMALNPKTNKKLFMIAQSYMPAQNIHVLINSNNSALSPWYELDEKATTIETPEWRFSSSELKRF